MNIQETIQLLKRQWCTIEDLIKLAQVSRTSAFKIKQEIVSMLAEKGYKLPQGLLPMNEVVNHLKIDLDYLERVS